MININKLFFKYSSGFSVQDISFTITDGEIFTIVGKNGSGKTTIIRNVMGFMKPEKGTVEIDGLNPFIDQEKILNNLGYIPGEINFNDHLTSRELFMMKRNLLNLKDDSYLQYLIKYFEIDQNKKIKHLSKGNKQKVAIILCMMNKPKYLILDEPTSGLDIDSQNKFWKEIMKFKKDNATILLCSHIISEINNISDKILVIDEGKIIELKEKNNFRDGGE